MPHQLALRAGALLLLGVSLHGLQGEDVPGREWELEVPAPSGQRTRKILEGQEQHECAGCHAQIVEEWASTRHALAWVEALFVEELENIRKPAKCHGCHAPQPMLVTGIETRPVVREEKRHLGVDCNACHLGPEGAMHGPLGTQTDAHASVKSEVFTPAGSNELCLTCHSKSIGPVIGIGRDFDDEELGDAGYSCIACHMAPVERPMAAGADMETPSPPHKGRSHELQTPRDPAFLRQAFDLHLGEQDGARGLYIANRAGHRVPGLNDRRLVFTVEELSASGELLATQEVEISREEPLRVRARLFVRLAELGTKTCRVRALHTAKSLKKPVEFLDLSLEL